MTQPLTQPLTQPMTQPDSNRWSKKLPGGEKF